MSGFFRGCLDGLKGCAGQVKDTAVYCFDKIKKSCNGENNTDNNSEININQSIADEQNNNELNSSKKNNNKNYVDNKMFLIEGKRQKNRDELLKELEDENKDNDHNENYLDLNKISDNQLINNGINSEIPNDNLRQVIIKKQNDNYNKDIIQENNIAINQNISDEQNLDNNNELNSSEKKLNISNNNITIFTKGGTERREKKLEEMKNNQSKEIKEDIFNKILQKVDEDKGRPLEKGTCLFQKNKYKIIINNNKDNTYIYDYKLVVKDDNGDVIEIIFDKENLFKEKNNIMFLLLANFDQNKLQPFEINSNYKETNINNNKKITLDIFEPKEIRPFLLTEVEAGEKNDIIEYKKYGKFFAYNTENKLQLSKKTIELILNKMALVNYEKFVMKNSHTIDKSISSYCKKIREEENKKENIEKLVKTLKKPLVHDAFRKLKSYDNNLENNDDKNNNNNEDEDSLNDKNFKNNNLKNEDEINTNNNNEIEENKEDGLLLKISLKFDKIYYNYNSERNLLIQNNEVLNNKADDLIKKYHEIKNELKKGACGKATIERFSKEVDGFCEQVEEERKKPENIEYNKENVAEKVDYYFSLIKTYEKGENEVAVSLHNTLKLIGSFSYEGNKNEKGKENDYNIVYKKIQKNLSLLYKKMGMEYEMEDSENKKNEEPLSLANNLLIQVENLCDELIERYEELIKQNNRESQSLFEQRINRLNTSSLDDNKSIHGHSYQGDRPFVEMNFNETDSNLNNESNEKQYHPRSENGDGFNKKAGINLDDESKTSNLSNHSSPFSSSNNP